MNDSASTTNNPSASQPQRADGTPIGEYFNGGMQSYADFHPEPEASHDEFMWDPNLFTNPQIYPPSVASHTPVWNQNAPAQSRDPPISAYGGLQSSFQLSPYGQPPFDPRQPSPQPGHDPRLIPRPAPSPAQYSNANQPVSMGYQEMPFQNRQPFNPQEMVYPQRRPAASTPTFDANTNRSSYFNYASQMIGQPQLQGMELPTDLAGFPEQSQHRHGHPYIDPTFLTANTMQRRTADSAQNLYPYLRQDNHKVLSAGHQTPISMEASNVQSGGEPPNQQGGFMGVFVHSKLGQVVEKARKPKDPNALKRPRGRPRKDGTQPLAKQGAHTSTSESESDELQIVEMPEPTPDLLRAPPPEIPEDRVIYDIAVAVWSPRNKPAAAEKVRHGIALFGDVVKKQRDAWKVKNEALKQAELANTTAIPSLKQEVAQFRKTIDTVGVQALRFGHPAHLAKLGENPFTMSALQSFLVDRINALDMDGSLVNSILKLMDRFTTLDEDMLEKTKTSKILTRLTKKAGNEVKKLAQSVLDHAASASKRRAASLAAAEGRGSPMGLNGHQKPPVAAGLKRPREADGGILPSTKRTLGAAPVRQASKPLALQNAERKKLESAATKAKTVGPIPNGISSNAAAGMTKAAATAAPASRPDPSPFSGLMSASKKPGTSNAARAAAAKDRPVAPTVYAHRKSSPPPAPVAGADTVPAAKSEAYAAPAAKSTFSFMDTLADMSRPKQVEQKKVDEIPLETEEEREKRLRKEARRKLRVSWAPENELTQVKLFVHDPEEETGHADSARRDVDDVGGEGRMLKLHKDLEDFEDEEEARATTEDLEKYHAPSGVDFDDLDESARQTSFLSRGGKVRPDSAETEAQEAREQTTLMVVYALPSDVPPTPKEPPAAGDEDDYTPATSFGEPEEKIRQREDQYYKASQPAANPNTDISAVLNLMRQNQQPAQPGYNSFPSQAQLQQPEQAPGVDLSKILAVMSQLQQPQPQPQPVLAAQPPAQSGSQQFDLAALLAQIQGQQQQQQADPNHNPAQNIFSPSSYNYSIGANQQNPYPGPAVGAGGDNAPSNSGGGSSSEYDESGWKGKSAGSAGGAVKPHPKAKTVICKFWQEGKCKKGDDCTFIHD